MRRTQLLVRSYFAATGSRLPARDFRLATTGSQPPAPGRLLRGGGPVVTPACVLPALVPVLERRVLRQPAQHVAAVRPQRGREQEPRAARLLFGQQNGSFGEQGEAGRDRLVGQQAGRADVLGVP